MQSGAILHFNKGEMQTKAEALQTSKQIAKQLNCTDDKQWLQCLRGVDANQINTIETIFTYPLEGTDFLPMSVQNAFNQSNYLQGATNFDKIM